MAPFIPIIFGAGLVAWLATRGGKSATPGSSDGPFQLDPNLPADLRQAVIIALNTETDSGKLRTFASALRGEGYILSAQQLETKANALDALNGVQPQAPDVPPAPPAIPPAPNQPPVVVPPAPPVFVVPSQPGTLELPPTVIQQQGTFDTGAFPGLGSAGGAGNFSLDSSIQAYLQDFYSLVNVAYPNGASRNDPSGSMRDPSLGVINYSGVDGAWGPKSQLALWGFQRWSNDFAGTNLSEDGMPGPASLAALQAWASANGAPSH